MMGLRAQKNDLQTPFERDSLQTATYAQGIAWYERFAAAAPRYVRLTTEGSTDVGLPLHRCVVSADGAFTPQAARAAGKYILLLNNAIHPGEPEGVDATMLFLRELATTAAGQKWLKKVVIVAIPFYNVDGALLRNRFTRANQNGPESYGFRGNAQNLDLNRDFIKCDSRNAQTFNQIFNTWQPDLLLDNHTSNGADYRYTMTVIATQSDKLETPLADFQQQTLLPALHVAMQQRGFDLSPYINFEESPTDGITGFLDLPRYSTGYAALHHTLGFMPETHMLKTFAARVRATLAFEQSLLEVMDTQAEVLLQARRAAFAKARNRQQFDLTWTLDSTRRDSLWFKGYEAKYKPSAVSGLPRLYYDHAAPFERFVPYLPHFRATTTVQKPRVYVLPQAYRAVAERLRWNGVTMRPLDRDTLIEADFYRVEQYKANANAYEGHHPNTQTKWTTVRLKRQYFRGDYWISTDQASVRYLVETLEPMASDAFFVWNFFDGILMQKEGYSDYVFEDTAAQLLRDNPSLRSALEAAKANDATLRSSGAAQLEWVYLHSPYYEPTHRIYPVARLF
jgi:hypothetical protein